MCTQVYIEPRAKEVHETFCFAYTFNLTLSVRGAVSYLQLGSGKIRKSKQKTV